MTTTNKILIVGFTAVLLVIGALGYFLIDGQNQSNAQTNENEQEMLSEQKTANRIAEQLADVAAQQCYQDRIQAYKDEKNAKRIAEGKEPLEFFNISSMLLISWESSCKG
ncbi:MAG: hypothetical protein GXP34_09900 [Actinobacteria bacterium]|nr:hypothetical protein [Actinomycetota bacterium]